ncbi:MAG: hypothetical protein Q27BB25_19485 [Blastomonas sp. CACIA14H2]|nr:MAG: hypothetical protein Q27BB25_19485 [Blastomonas sp. CACIA14H2]
MRADMARRVGIATFRIGHESRIHHACALKVAGAVGRLQSEIAQQWLDIMFTPRVQALSLNTKSGDSGSPRRARR